MGGREGGREGVGGRQAGSSSRSSSYGSSLFQQHSPKSKPQRGQKEHNHSRQRPRTSTTHSSNMRL